MTPRLCGSVLGLLSFGAIAQAVAARAAAFGMRALACDPYLPDSDITARGATPSCGRPRSARPSR